MSTYDLLGIPTQIGITLFTLGLGLALAPYLGGKDLGPLKVPVFDDATARRLKVWGWPAPIFALALFAPVWTSPDAGPQPFDVRLRFQSSTKAELECARLAGATATIRVGAQAFRAPVDGTCVATVEGLSPELRNQEARVEIAGAEGFVPIGEQQAFILEPGQEWTVTLDDARTAPRLRISILPYQAAGSETLLQQFREALTDRIITMTQQLSARHDAYEYVTRVKVQNEGPAAPSVAELRSYWDSNHALQLVRGQVDASTQPVTVHQLIYLGDLAPGRDQVVQLDVRVAPGEFARTQDAYSVVMLYSLARDAQRLGLPANVVVGFLSEAHSIAQQIGDAGGQLAGVNKAVSELLRDLAGPGAQP